MADVVLGIDRLSVRLKDFRRKYSKGLERGLKKGAVLLKKTVVPFIPREDGDLAKSLQVISYQEGGKPISEVVIEAPYAAAVHNRPPSEVSHGSEYNLKHSEDIQKRKRYWYKGRMKRYHRRKPLESYRFLSLAYEAVSGQIRNVIIDEVKK